MAISAALIGLPQSGKTTVFSAVTGLPYRKALEVETAAGFARAAVPVPDERADSLADLIQPERVVRLSIEFVDVAGGSRSLAGLLSGAALNTVAQCDLLVAVVRAFEDPALPHPAGTVDALRDLGNVLAEIEFADLEIVDRRLKRIGEQMKKVKPAEREVLHREQVLVSRLRDALEASCPIRRLDLSADELRSVRGYQFLSAKPVVAVFNVSEEGLAVAEGLAERSPIPAQVVAGKLEAEAVEMPEDEADQLLRELGVKVRSRQGVPRLCFENLGLVRFYTFNPEEVHVWAVPAGTPVVEAAGQIHSDLQRGFIRAEVVRFGDFMRFGSVAEARKHGALKVEGRNYLVQDGDVIHILFSV